VLTILLTYWFVREFYDKKMAFLASFFVTIFPSHIFLSRIGFEYIIVNFFGLLAMFFLIKFVKSKRKKYLYFFSIVAGFGIATRLSFFLFLIPLLLLSKIFFKISLKKLDKKDLLFCFLIICLFIYPYIFYSDC
jgi:4-amino-4-deoxy-L-arabinose transferase-like glycosyltransferase